MRSVRRRHKYDRPCRELRPPRPRSGAYQAMFSEQTPMLPMPSPGEANRRPVKPLTLAQAEAQSAAALRVARTLQAASTRQRAVRHFLAPVCGSLPQAILRLTAESARAVSAPRPLECTREPDARRALSRRSQAF